MVTLWQSLYHNEYGFGKNEAGAVAIICDLFAVKREAILS